MLIGTAILSIRRYARIARVQESRVSISGAFRLIRTPFLSSIVNVVKMLAFEFRSTSVIEPSSTPANWFNSIRWSNVFDFQSFIKMRLFFSVRWIIVFVIIPNIPVLYKMKFDSLKSFVILAMFSHSIFFSKYSLQWLQTRSSRLFTTAVHLEHLPQNTRPHARQ